MSIVATLGAIEPSPEEMSPFWYAVGTVIGLGFWPIAIFVIIVVPILVLLKWNG
jgi:hypothetical protein